MKLCFFLLSLLIFCPIIVKAQANFKPGLVVTMEGDTLRGYINYREWEFSPASVTFRTDANSGAEKVYDTGNARYFEITGMEAYQRYQGPVTMNPVAIDRISFEPKALLEQVEVFLKVNYEGELVDLLSYTDKLKTRFFFQEKDGSQPQELFYNRYYASSNSSQVIIQKGYVGQIQYLVNKYDVSTARLNTEIEATQYNEVALENLFHKLNVIRVSSPATKDLRSSRTRYFAGITVNKSSMRMIGVEGINEPDNLDDSFLPMITFGFDAFLNKHIQKYYFRVEGALSASNYFVKSQKHNNYGYTQYSYKIAQQNIYVSPQLIYNIYNQDNLKFHIGLVGQVNFSNYSHNNYKVIKVDNYIASRNRTDDYPGMLDLMNLWLNYGFRTGIVVNKRYEIYGKYTPYAAVTQYFGTSVEFETISGGVNYLFIR